MKVSLQFFCSGAVVHLRERGRERDRTSIRMSGLWWQDGWHVNCLVDVEVLRHTGLMLAKVITKVAIICN